MNENNSSTRLQERFVRWQQALRESLGTHITLIVAFASGGLGFVGSILDDERARFTGCTPWLILGAGVMFLAALFLALFVSWNRLEDVRATLEILRHRRDKSPESVIDALQTRTDALGKRTWKLVYWQLTVFMIAAALFCAGIFLAFEHRLFPTGETAQQLSASEQSTATPPE